MADYQENRFSNASGLALNYRVYGHGQAGTPVICLPGITRNCRDFHEIAEHLSADRMVITMDFRGRGLSDWDPEWHNYKPTTYPSDVLELLDHLDVARAVFFGTSLGGLVSMIVASEHPERVAAVILNDIGPEIGPDGLARIKGYIGRAEPVGSWDEAVEQARSIYGLAWKDLTDEEWLVQAKRGYREDASGTPVLDMDPMVGEAARTVDTTLKDPWQLFDDLPNVPIMVLHGESSDILTFDIVDKMSARRPELVHVVVSNRGHVPILDEPDCLRGIDSFFRSLPDKDAV
ncbi:MAG: alpha/beta hydrolase [Pseudomonadota bacterium]